VTKSQKVVNAGLLAVLGGGIALAVTSLGQPKAAEAPLRTAPVQRGVVQSTVSASGNVQAAASIDLSFGASGTLTRIAVKVGQRVKAGQVLAQVDETNARSTVASAQASLEQAQAQLASDRQSTSAQVVSAEDSLAAARRSLADTKKINRDQIIAAEQQVKQAESQVAADRVTAPTAVTNAQSSLAQAEGSISYTQALNDRQLEAAQQDVDAAAATLSSDQAKLGRDQATELSDCGTNNPTITSSTSNSCRNSAQSVITDQTTVTRDQTSLLGAQNALAQLQLKTAQSLDQAKAQRDSAARALVTAKTSNAQTLERDTQALASARTSLSQTRTKAAQSVSQAQAQVRSAQLSLANARASLATLDGSQVSQDLARIHTAEVQLATAQDGLRDTALSAPVAGTVSAISVSVGQLVSGGAAAAFTLTDLDRLQVVVGFPETDAAKIRAGQAATVTLDALAGRQLAAHVISVSPTAAVAENVVTYAVTLALDRTRAGVKPGMTAAVEVVTAHRDGILNVPSSAVSSSGDQATVVVLRGKEQVTVPVVTGLAGDSTTEIAGGLSEGDLVVLPTVRVTGGSTTPSSSFGPGGGSFGGGVRLAP
jgi:HlyD family secretion protein